MAASGCSTRTHALLARSPPRRNEQLTGTKTANPLVVNVKTHEYQRFAVWFGGSLQASMDSFHANVKTRQIYEELGPACMRHNVALGA
eukprot:SAG22_NODE_5308_length_1040_cov_1.315622_2_plen_88_part_00